MITYARVLAGSLPENLRGFGCAYQMPARSNFVGMFLDPLFVVRPGDSKVTITVCTSETLTVSRLP